MNCKHVDPQKDRQQRIAREHGDHLPKHGAQLFKKDTLNPRDEKRFKKSEAKPVHGNQPGNRPTAVETDSQYQVGNELGMEQRRFRSLF